MYPLNQYSSSQYKEFEARFISICQKHRNEDRAMFFAFLLYGIEHPFIVRMLQDNANWNALDRISGDTLTIFAFKKMERPKPHRSGGGTRYMQLILDAGNLPEKDPYAMLKKHFAISEADFPGIMFFQVHEENVIGSFYVPIRTRKTEDCYNEVVEIVSLTKDSVSAVLEENKSNSREIFNLVVSTLTDHKHLGYLSRGVNKIIKIIPFVHLLAGA